MIEDQIESQLKVALDPGAQIWMSAKIVPRRTNSKNWRAENSNLPRHGRPRFSFRATADPKRRAITRAKSVADALDAGSMAQGIERVEKAVDTDPELAIGTAKELVEGCCKSILVKCGVQFSKSVDMNELVKLTLKQLQLVPENVSDQAKGAENIRLILRNLTQLTNNLAQLRGLYGSGHGKAGQHRGLQARHARLAVAAAVAFIDFAAETFRQRRLPKPQTTVLAVI